MEKEQNAESYIIVTFIFKKEDEVWTAECKELGTATFGDTLDEAQDDLIEAVVTHLNTLEDVGECERFLKERHVAIHPKRPEKMHVDDLPFDPSIFVSQNIQPVHVGAAC
jgi:predicted RNase H-like HicB family nuclease